MKPALPSTSVSLDSTAPDVPGAVLARLSGLHPKIIDLSLGRIERLLAVLGRPQDALAPVVHVAGTNGKGSTIAFLRAMLEAAGLRWETSLVRGGAAACTGNRHCKYASSDTKTHTMELVEWLEERIVLDTPINIHTTGCPHSCAQHYIGDIGLLACKVPGAVEGETIEGYHVFVGGGFGEDRKQLGRQLLKSVPAGPELYGKIESLLRAYLKERSGPGETFQQFTTARGIETLASYLPA